MPAHRGGRRLSWSVESNAWNRIRYTLWAPLYDLVGRRFDGRRRHSLGLLGVQPGERVVLIGAGTGGDLPYLPAECTALATDLTPAMLSRARRRRPGTHLALMDGQRLAVRSASCEAVVLHLILAVIPEPLRCLQETARVLRAGGRAVVFDKFAPTRRPSLALRAVNALTRLLFTDITRNLEDLLERSGAPLRVEADQRVLPGGLFRHVLLRKA